MGTKRVYFQKWEPLKHTAAIVSGGSTYKFPAPPPPTNRTKFFRFYMFSLKSACVGGWHPLRGLVPPQREILEPPLIVFELRITVMLFLDFQFQRGIVQHNFHWWYSILDSAYINL